MSDPVQAPTPKRFKRRHKVAAGVVSLLITAATVPIGGTSTPVVTHAGAPAPKPVEDPGCFGPGAHTLMVWIGRWLGYDKRPPCIENPNCGADCA